MTDVVDTALLFVALMTSVGLGWSAQHRLQERHVSPATVESIRLLMGMLLTSSAKQRFDGYNSDLSAFSAELIELDHRLRVYGPEADAIRASLRRYTAAAIADTWPNETQPAGEYPRFRHLSGPRNIEGTALGEMLSDVDVAIEQLAPGDAFHRQIAARLRDRVAEVIQRRWELIFSARSTISWPFLLVLTAWLSIIFGIFGLTAPRSRLVLAVVSLSAASIASPLYLIIDYGEARNGGLQFQRDDAVGAGPHGCASAEARLAPGQDHGGGRPAASRMAASTAASEKASAM